MQVELRERGGGLNGVRITRLINSLNIDIIELGFSDSVRIRRLAIEWVELIELSVRVRQLAIGCFEFLS